MLGEFERSVLTKDQLAQKTGKDQGEDLGVQGGGTLGLESGANMMLEVVNMVDFFEGNKLWKPTVDEATNQTTYTYPVSAKGMAADKMLEEVYRQFLVASFQARGSPTQQARYTLAQTHFAGILGITPEREADVTKDIGKVVYSQYVNQLLKSKGKVEPQDFQLLVNIQQTLKMDDDYCLELLANLQKNFLREQVANVFKAPKLTGELAKMLRTKADGMGLDVRTDLGIDVSKRSELFLAEVSGLIESGEVTDDDKDVIEDVQDAWGIDSDVALKDFTKLVESTCLASIKSAAADLRNSNERSAVRYLEKMLSYAQFIPAAVSDEAKVDRPTKEKLVVTYSAAKASFDDSSGPDTVLQKKLELLSTVLGL